MAILAPKVNTWTLTSTSPLDCGPGLADVEPVAAQTQPDPAAAVVAVVTIPIRPTLRKYFLLV